MVQILIGIFIKKDINTPQGRQSVAVLCSIMSITFNLLLFVGKLIIGTMSGSVAITADAFNNLADAGTCLAELLGFFVAGVGAGKRHPFGHGRIEWLMGLFAAITVLFMGFEMLKTSISSVASPQPVNFSKMLVVVLICSIAIKGYMFLYNRKIGKKIGSITMKAKAFDCLGDLASTTTVLLSILVTRFFGWQVDGWCGIAVSVFIFYAGIQALNETISPLIGKAPDESLVEQIEKRVKKYPEVTDIYDLMVHDYGFNRLFVSFHIGCYSKIGINELLSVADNLSNRLCKDLECETTVQIELLSTDKALIEGMFSQALKSVHEVGDSMEINQFRILKNETQMNAIMDLVIPRHLLSREYEAKKAIQEAIKLLDKNICVMIKTKICSSANKHHKSNK